LAKILLKTELSRRWNLSGVSDGCNGGDEKEFDHLQLTPWGLFFAEKPAKREK
jgi:hypothetical protein